MEYNIEAPLISDDIDVSVNNIQWELFNPDISSNNETRDDNPYAVTRSTAGAPSREKTVREVQQYFAENCGFEEKVIWDLIPSNEPRTMRYKIEQLIPDQPQGQNAIEELRNTLFGSVWAQRKYTNGTSVSSIFYAMVVVNAPSAEAARNSTQFSIHPVFRLKKCDDNSNSRNCCMIYVDETGRVYQNWNSFVLENVFPPGYMIVPPNGVYIFDKDNKAILHGYRTPRGTENGQLMEFAQNTSAAAGIGAILVPIASLVIPVAAPILTLSRLVGLTVGAFTAITSARNLSDRQNHEQSISLANRQARANYLGVLGGTVGIASLGATRVLRSVAAAGRVTTGMEVLVNSFNISSIMISGSGAVNGVLDLILKRNDGEEITAEDLLQLSASLVLFTHSVHNFQLASTIANDARVNSIKSYRESLSNRQRKMFDKISKETIRIRGSTQGKIDIIRGVNEIPDRQYLNDLFKINKQLNQNNVKPAFGANGKNIVLNNDLAVDTGVLRQSVQHQNGPDILNQISKPIPSTNGGATFKGVDPPKEARLLYSTGNVKKSKALKRDPLKENGNNTFRSILHLMAVSLPCGRIMELGEYGMNFIKNIVDGRKFEDVIICMTQNLTEKTSKYLMKLTQGFMDNLVKNIEQILRIVIPTESVLFRIVKQVLDEYRNVSYEYISQRGQEIVGAVNNYYLSLNPNNSTQISQKCKHCNGRFYICM